MNSEASAGVTAAAAGVKAGDQARVPAGDKAKTAVGSLNKLTNQPFKKSTPFKGGDLMPVFDRTGPMGAGPMTGGAGGRCNPATSTAIPAYSGGYGYGRGLGRRRGGVDTAPMQVGVAAMAEATGGIRPRLFPPIQQVHPMR